MLRTFTKHINNNYLTLQRCCPKILTKSQFLLDHNVNLSELIDLQYFTKNTCRSGPGENRFYFTVFN